MHIFTSRWQRTEIKKAAYDSSVTLYDLNLKHRKEKASKFRSGGTDMRGGVCREKFLMFMVGVMILGAMLSYFGGTMAILF